MRGWTIADETAAARLAGERPLHLYKYCECGPSSRDRLRAALTRSALPVPSYADLNDPFDGCAPFDFDADDRPLRHHWEVVARRRLEETGERPPSDAALAAQIDRLVEQSRAHLPGPANGGG